MNDLDSELSDPPRWNSWFNVSPVDFGGKDRPIPRRVRPRCRRRSGRTPRSIQVGSFLTRFFRVETPDVVHLPRRKAAALLFAQRSRFDANRRVCAPSAWALMCQREGAAVVALGFAASMVRRPQSSHLK